MSLLSGRHQKFLLPGSLGWWLPGSGRRTSSARSSTFSIQSRVWDAGLDPISPAAFFGPRPLTEDGHERSRSTTALVNARLGYRLENGMALRLDAFNLFNTKASQIDYWYASRLTGEPAAGRGF